MACHHSRRERNVLGVAHVGVNRVTTADSSYAGGRRGKERAASLRAEQRLAAGGRRLPRPGLIERGRMLPRAGRVSSGRWCRVG
jgi:hypothetical protein